MEDNIAEVGDTVTIKDNRYAVHVSIDGKIVTFINAGSAEIQNAWLTVSNDDHILDYLQ